MIGCLHTSPNFNICVYRLLFKNAYDPHLYTEMDLQSHWNTVSHLCMCHSLEKVVKTLAVRSIFKKAWPILCFK